MIQQSAHTAGPRRSLFLAVGLIAGISFALVAGQAASGVANFLNGFGTTVDVRQAPALTLADDYYTRHFGIRSAPALSFGDDYGTRHASAGVDPAAVWSERLTKLAEHYGINQGAVESQSNPGVLDTKDDYGTRHPR